MYISEITIRVFMFSIVLGLGGGIILDIIMESLFHDNGANINKTLKKVCISGVIIMMAFWLGVTMVNTYGINF